MIGDVVGSRASPDRGRLHRALTAALDEVAAPVSVRPARVTVGDEFQIVCSSVAAAVDVAFRVRLALSPQIDTRYGIGWGTAQVLDAATGIEDGSAWWGARAAIERVEEEAQRPGLENARTSFAVDPSVRVPSPTAESAAGELWPLAPDAMRAALLCRDHLVGSLDARSLRILEVLLAGGSQFDAARAEGVSASAVSQRVRRHGIAVALAAHRGLVGEL